MFGPIPRYTRFTPPSFRIFLAAPMKVNDLVPVCACYVVLITSCGCDMIPAMTAAVPPALNLQIKSLHLYSILSSGEFFYIISPCCLRNSYIPKYDDHPGISLEAEAKKPR